MRQLVEEAAAAVNEYQQKVQADSIEVEFEMLPEEGFCVTRSADPR